MAREEKRFVRVYTQNGFSSASEIWVDRETKVCYLWHISGNGGGLTPLLDAEGRPKLWREPLED